MNQYANILHHKTRAAERAGGGPGKGFHARSADKLINYSYGVAINGIIRHVYTRVKEFVYFTQVFTIDCIELYNLCVHSLSADNAMEGGKKKRNSVKLQP